MSRYFTLSVAKNKPTAKQKTKARIINKGNSKTSMPGNPLITKNMMRKTTNEIAKSIKQTNKDDAGNKIFGKYTLVRIFELLISELLISEIEVEISCHSITPQETTRKRSP